MGKNIRTTVELVIWKGIEDIPFRQNMYGRSAIRKMRAYAARQDTTLRLAAKPSLRLPMTVQDLNICIRKTVYKCN